MARISRLFLAAFGTLVIVACVGVATGAFKPDVTVSVENTSFDMTTVRVFCGGGQVWRFSNVVPASEERKKLRLTRCSQVDILVSYFGQPYRDILFGNIGILRADAEIVVNIGNAPSTTWYMIRE